MNTHGGTSAPSVECTGMSSGYRDGVEALSGVSFRVDAGERVGIVGPNGAGKSTLLRAFVGVQPFIGEIRIDGLRMEKHNLREIRSRIGLVFQNPDDQLFSSTIREDVAFGPLAMGYSGEEARIRVEEALASVGMEYAAGRNPLHLSFGERRLAAIATVLSMQPSILAMDEPSSNLDPRHRRRLIDWLNSGADFTLLLASHDLDMVAQCCDRVLILDTSIRADAPAHELLTDAELLAAHGLEPPLGFQKLEFRSLR